MEASVSDEEKLAVPNVPEKLFKNSYLKVTPKKLPRSVSAQLRSYTVIYLACTRWLHLVYLDTKPKLLLSEWFQFITSFAHSGL